MDQFESYLQYQKEITETKLKIINRFQKADPTETRKTYVKNRNSKKCTSYRGPAPARFGNYSLGSKRLPGSAGP